MALMGILRDATEQTPEDVVFLKFESEAFALEPLLEVLAPTLEKFKLKQIFHNMNAVVESTAIQRISNSSYSEVNTQRLRQEGAARVYANGRHMLAIHDFLITASESTSRTYHDPTIYVLGSDSEAEEIAADVKTRLVRALASRYMETDSKDGRYSIAQDIANNLQGRTGTEVYDDLNKLIDEELLVMQSQVLNKVMSYESSTTKRLADKDREAA